MSSLPYSVLNLFESPRGYLAEIARIPRPGPESEWVWIERRRATTLQPVDSGEGLTFEEGTLRLDGRQGELCRSDGRSEALTRRDPQALPPPLRGLLELHLT